MLTDKKTARKNYYIKSLQFMADVKSRHHKWKNISLSFAKGQFFINYLGYVQ